MISPVSWTRTASASSSPPKSTVAMPLVPNDGVELAVGVQAGDGKVAAGRAVGQQQLAVGLEPRRRSSGRRSWRRRRGRPARRAGAARRRRTSRRPRRRADAHDRDLAVARADDDRLAVGLNRDGAGHVDRARGRTSACRPGRTRGRACRRGGSGPARSCRPGRRRRRSTRPRPARRAMAASSAVPKSVTTEPPRRERVVGVPPG